MGGYLIFSLIVIGLSWLTGIKWPAIVLFMMAAGFLFFGSQVDEGLFIGIICAIGGFGYLFLQRTAENEGEQLADKLNKRASAMREFKERFAQEKQSKEEEREAKYQEWLKNRLNK